MLGESTGRSSRRGKPPNSIPINGLAAKLSSRMEGAPNQTLSMPLNDILSIRTGSGLPNRSRVPVKSPFSNRR